MNRKHNPSLTPTTTLASDELGEVSFSYVSLLGAVALAGIAGLTGLGGAFQDGISGDAQGQSASVPTASVAAQAGLAQALVRAADPLAHVTERLGGVKRAASELLEVADDLINNPEMHAAVGFDNPTKGVILTGPGGAGKTALAKTVAEAVGANFTRIKASDLIDAQGPAQTAARIEQVFAEARQSAPTVLLIDDVEQMTNAMKEGFGSHILFNPIENQIERLDAADRVVTILGTKNLADLEKFGANLRTPGAFDRVIELGAADKSGVLEMLEANTRKMLLGDDVSLDEIATGLDSALGRDVRSLVSEAAMNAKRRLEAAIAAGETSAPARIEAAEASRVELAIPNWDNPFEVADVLESWADTYSFNEQFDQATRGMAAALRNKLAQGELFVPDEEFATIKGHIEQATAMVEKAEKDGELIVKGAPTRSEALKAARAEREASFPIIAKDFEDSLKKLRARIAQRNSQIRADEHDAYLHRHQYL